MILESRAYAYVAFIGKHSFFNLINFLDYELCRYKPSSIAISSILMMLESKPHLFDFRTDWMDFIMENFQQIDLNEVENCCQLLSQIFSEESDQGIKNN